ncbi:MAG: hypothetical protein U0935_00385 [Pirellulales bacterium]
MSKQRVAIWAGWVAFSFVLTLASGLQARDLRQPEPNESVASPSDVVPGRPSPRQTQAPTQSPQQSPAAWQQSPSQAPVQKGAVCVPPCIRYIEHGHARRCCGERYETVLTYCDPCTGCQVNIPICLPTCCNGPLASCERVGALGRSVIVYRWCCGFAVKIITDRCGDVTVHIFNR